MNRNYGETASTSGCLPAYFFPVATLGLCLFIAGLACSRGDTQSQARVLSFDSGDGVRLTATLYAPDAVFPPGIILAHRYGGYRGVWERTARTLKQHGIMAIAVDLRGHGESRLRNGAAIHYRQIPQDAWLDALEDIRAAKKALLEAGAHPDNLAVAGEGLGASLALHYALDDPDMQAVIMISPGLDTQGIHTEEAIKKLVDCPTLLIAGEGDSYAAMSATALNNAAPVYSELRTWSGGAHGVDLFAAHPEATHFILEWLRNIFASASIE
ncbi:MAG TPA: alpha/beta fold hydrolase [Candidatus Hydrogenedentes bacterium]|nr:alpha/beta fold hydrolase [Candidatus Hydrogenedentota bacterium]